MSNNWISIKEQKPSDGQEVIILYNDEPRIAVAHQLVNGTFVFGLDFEWVDGAEWNALTRRENQIEYWQPLPKANAE